MGFFFVAVRYDPPPDAKPQRAIATQTLRVTFATPIPYVPYREPADSRSEADGARLLELWYVGEPAVVPVALRERDGTRQWVRPLQEGREHQRARPMWVEFDDALPPELSQLLPPGPLVVQTFQDQKRTRIGFGDVLFAHRHAHALDAAQRAALDRLLGILDPALVQESP
jgi:hypothetical protein